MNNNDEFIASLIARRDALSTILIKHTSEGGALTCIADYIDDPACISSPSLISALDTLLGDDPELTQAAEIIYMIGGPEIGIRFCERNELCAVHFCDFENCEADH